METLEDYCKKIKCPHYKKGEPCDIENCEIRDGEMDSNYPRQHINESLETRRGDY